MVFLSKLTKWLLIISSIFIGILLITYFTSNSLLNKIDIFLEKDRNLSNIQTMYSKELNNYLTLLNIYRWFQPDNSKLLICQSYLLALRNYPQHSKIWVKDIDRIKSNLSKITYIDKGQFSIQDYLKLALASKIINNQVRSSVFSDLAIKKAGVVQTREIAFFSYWYLKNYLDAREYYEKYFQEIGGYDKDPSAFVEYLDVLLSDYLFLTNKLKEALKNVSLIDKANEPMLAFLKQRVSLKLYELCSVKPEMFYNSDCNIYYEKAKNEFAVSKYQPENVISPDLIVSQIKVRLFRLGVPDTFLYFNVNKDNLETYKKVFEDAFQQLRETELLYAKENIFNNHFYLFLLGYLSEFNNNLSDAKMFYEKYLETLQNQSILDSQEQKMLSIAFYRLARVNIIIDISLYTHQIIENKVNQNLFTSFETVKTSFNNLVSQENIFLNQEIANKLLNY